MWKLAEILGLVVDIQLELDRREGATALAEAEALATGTGWLECRMPAARSRAVVDRDVGVARAYRTKPRPSRGKSSRPALLVLGELDDDPAANLAAAYRAFDSCGAAPWRRAAPTFGPEASPCRRVTRARVDLTDTEMQLVRLVREGYSNRRIAAAMRYSRKTIEVYLSRVYARRAAPPPRPDPHGQDTGGVPA